MTDAKIASRFVWNAQRLYRYSDQSKSFVRFYDEPWTANRFWEIQVNFMLTYMERTHSIICLVPLEESECTTLLFYNVRRQEQVVVFWFSERIPSSHAMRKYTYFYAKRNRVRRWSHCWMAPSGAISIMRHQFY